VEGILHPAGDAAGIGSGIPLTASVIGTWGLMGMAGAAKGVLLSRNRVERHFNLLVSMAI
jgi:hypothetical protein